VQDERTADNGNPEHTGRKIFAFHFEHDTFIQTEMGDLLMNNIQIFNNPEFGDIRTVVIDNEPWFVGKDVADILGYQNGSRDINRHVDEEDKRLTKMVSQGQNRDITVINESGLYSLIFGSKLESAKKFKKWVTSEVLPSIRKTGTYMMPQTTDGKIALLAQGHTELKAEVDEIKADLESLKMDLPILPVEADRITEAVRKKGVSIMGGKQSSAYSNRGLRQKVYNNLYANLKYNFGVRSYKSIKRSQCDKAVQVINAYQTPYFLQEQIDDANMQQRLEFE
jgi:prophage antirepressor-like protein